MDGYVLMILVAIIHSFPAIAIKYTYDSTNALTSQTLWFLSAFLWSLALKQKISIKKPVLIFSFLNIFSLIIYFLSIQALGASVVSFIQKSETLFIVLFGLLLFKERFNKMELFGFIIAIIGVIAVSYSEEKLELAYSLIAIFGFLINAYAFSVVKKYNDVHPDEYVASRAFFVLVASALLTFMTGSFKMPAPETFYIYAIVPLFAAIIAQRMQYTALMRIDFAKAGLIKEISPILTIVMAYLFLGENLMPRQLIGGAMLLVGISIVLLTKYEGKNNVKAIYE